MKIRNTVVASLLLLALTGCGTTSGIQQSDAEEVTFSVNGYDAVVIGEFTGDSSAMTFKGKTEEIITNKKNAFDEEAASVGAEFAQILATEIRSKGVFSDIKVGESDSENALLIDGTVKKFKEGNAAARLLIGFGAGSSNFDADVNIRNRDTGEILGTVVVDKNSWALGGAVAIAQDMRSHMISAAKKIASELEKAKLN